MQTIEEYKAYTQQLEGEVGKWHHAYDALVIERNALVRKILETEKSVSVKDHENGCDCVMLTKEAFEAMSNELEELKAKVNGLKNLANLWHYNAQNEHNESVMVNMEKIKLKNRADKLLSCLKCLVMRDLIKDCPEKESAIEIVKEYKNVLG